MKSKPNSKLEEKLYTDFRDALAAAQSVDKVEDGGTSNLDTVLVVITGLTSNMIDNLENRLDIHIYRNYNDADFINIRFHCPYQGFMRTRMVEAFVAVLNKRGYIAYVHYQMD